MQKTKAQKLKTELKRLQERLEPTSWQQLPIAKPTSQSLSDNRQPERVAITSHTMYAPQVSNMSYVVVDLKKIGLLTCYALLVEAVLFFLLQKHFLLSL